MRLSDENLRDIIALNASYTSIRLLAEEVLALRKCEEALPNVLAMIHVEEAHVSELTGTAYPLRVCGIDLGDGPNRAIRVMRAALAAVRELEET